MILFGDTETFSPEPIQRGVYRYAEQAELLLFAYAVDDGPVRVWDLTETATPPVDLLAALRNPKCKLVFHNANFDRTVIRAARPDLAELMPLHRWHCTMAQALAHSLPGSLDKLCRIFNLPASEAKDSDGKRLIYLFCCPQRRTGERFTRHTHPQDWAKFRDVYAPHDITSMRVLYRKMPAWNYRENEVALWHLDQIINDRGMAVDVELATAAVDSVARIRASLRADINDITNGAVDSATRTALLLKHILAEYGVDLPDMKAATLQRRIDDPELPPEVRALLEIRLQASNTSATKFQTLLTGVNTDGRLRGTMQFCGAQRTGRWAGRRFQPQNLKRPSFNNDEVTRGIRAIKAGAVDLVYDDPMNMIGSSARGAIIAPAGRKLVVADYANIEGRVGAWLAGQTWKIKAFEDYDAGVGPDMYTLAYARAFGVDPDDVTKAQRQIGKVMELMLQYEGGVGAYVTGALTYGIDLDELAAKARREIPPEVYGEAAGFYDWTVKQKRPTFGLARETFIVCDSLKRLWRKENDYIAATWPVLRDTMREVINSESGTVVRLGRLKFIKTGAWIRIVLPSGRSLSYPRARATEDLGIVYYGESSYTRSWGRIHTYGGKIFENIVQGVSRDLLAEPMPAIEDRGFGIVLSNHDELVTEAPDDDSHSLSDLIEPMAMPPTWAKGLPLAAAGFEAYRYRKD